MQTSDLTPQIDASNIHVVFLFNAGQAKLASFSHHGYPALAPVLEQVSRLCPEDLNSPDLCSVVVIDGIQSVRTYTAQTFRWLCGVGPDPAGKDPSWMG